MCGLGGRADVLDAEPCRRVHECRASGELCFRPIWPARRATRQSMASSMPPFSLHLDPLFFLTFFLVFLSPLNGILLCDVFSLLALSLTYSSNSYCAFVTEYRERDTPFPVPSRKHPSTPAVLASAHFSPCRLPSQSAPSEQPAANRVLAFCCAGSVVFLASACVLLPFIRLFVCRRRPILFCNGLVFEY